MAEKRDLYFDIQFGGNDDYSEEMIEANQDQVTKIIIDDEIKLKEGSELKTETEIEINGKDYHIKI